MDTVANGICRPPACQNFIRTRNRKSIWSGLEFQYFGEEKHLGIVNTYIRHTVVCWALSAVKKTVKNRAPHTSVLFTRTIFQPIVALKLLSRFLSNLYILVRPYTRPYIPNLKEIAPEF